MKMRKKLAAVLAAAMIASMMPMSAFAASTNRMNKTINVEKGEMLTTSHAVDLVIDMKNNDKFEIGSFFELKLTDAQWNEQALADAFNGGTIATAYSFDVDGNSGSDYSIRRESNSSLIVTSLSGIINDFRIPMVAKITGDNPVAEINPFDSAVSADKLGLVAATKGKALVTVASVPTIAKTDKMANITFDEPFLGAFKPNQEITLELRDTDFSFVQAGTLKGTKAFYTVGATTPTISANGEKLTVKLPAAFSSTQRGGFELSGVEIRPNRDARSGDIKATISGDFVDKAVLTVAKYGDYTTTLKVAEDDYNVVAGQKIDVKFTLAEDMANAIIGNRRATFTFSKGIVVHDVIVTPKEVGSTSNVVPVVVFDKDDKRTNVFEVDNLDPLSNKKSSYEFEATLYVPANFEGDINLEVEGRAFADELKAVVATTEAPATVEGTGATLKVGVQKQVTDAKIVIKETAKDRLAQKDIVISIADKDSGIQVTGADIKVTDGDLELDKVTYQKSAGTITIPVKRYSTEPSTIEITNIQFNVDRTVPEGSYDIKVTGTALSDLKTQKKGETAPTAGHTISSEVAKLKDFIVIGTPNTEDIAGGASKAKVQFVIGASQYLVNGVEQTMDAAAYAKDGRTMVPVRYVAAALGITGDKVVWDGPNQAVTIIADKTIQVKLGSKMMLIDGVSVPMSAAAEAVSGRVFVPVAEIARGLGVTVAWDSATQTATFN